MPHWVRCLHEPNYWYFLKQPNNLKCSGFCSIAALNLVWSAIFKSHKNTSKHNILFQILLSLWSFWNKRLLLLYKKVNCCVSQHKTKLLKFIYCEKASKSEKKSSTCFLHYLVMSKQSGNFYQIFVDFSEYLNFIKVFIYHWVWILALEIWFPSLNLLLAVFFCS